MCTLNVGHCCTQKPLPLQLQICQALSGGSTDRLHLTWSASFTGSNICAMIPEFRCCSFPFILSLCRCQKRVTTECRINQCLHMPVIFFFFTIASVRFFFLNGYSGVTQQLKGKTFKYLMSLNCSKTEIIVFLQIWVNIMDCETRPMIM